MDSDDEVSSVRPKTNANSKTDKDRTNNATSTAGAKKIVDKSGVKVKMIVNAPVNGMDSSDNEITMETFQNKPSQWQP